jgi:hypothetical protein
MFSNSFTSRSDNPENILSRSLAVKRRDETSPIPQTGTYLCTRLQSIGASLERLYQVEEASSEGEPSKIMEREDERT